MWNKLKGKKSYLLAITLGLVTVAYSLGWLEQEVYTTLAGLLGAGSVAALRKGME